MMDAGEIAARPLIFPPRQLFRRLPAAARSELAIRCALNRVGESTYIQRLGLNLDRSPRECIGRIPLQAILSSVALEYARAWRAKLRGRRHQIANSVQARQVRSAQIGNPIKPDTHALFQVGQIVRI